MSHQAIGRMRGHIAPTDEFLRRLVDINPAFRVHWYPAWGERPGYYVIAEHQEDPLFQSAGLARLDRWNKRDNELSGKLVTDPRPIWDVELMIDGGHVVGTWGRDGFGSEAMLFDLQKSEYELNGQRAKVQKGQQDATQKFVEDEAEKNADYRDMLRQWAKEDYNVVGRMLKHFDLGTTSQPEVSHAS